MSPDREPNRDELQAMAYADGELSEADRPAFEARLRSSPGIAKQVSEYRSLAVLARQMAPPEPMDHEWRRLAQDPLQKTGHGLGWTLLVAGALGLAGWLLSELFRSDMAAGPRMLSLAVIVGVLLLLLVTIRGRIRTLPYDPYEKVKR